MVISSNSTKQSDRNAALAAAIPSLAKKLASTAVSNGGTTGRPSLGPVNKDKSSSVHVFDGKFLSSSHSPRVIDIGVNLTHKSFHKNWKSVVHRSIQAGVDTLILTGTSLEGSKKSLDMAQEWFDETGSPNLWATVGVHPHHADQWSSDTSPTEMKALLQHPFAVAVGECGLDYNRNFSKPEHQQRAFREQLEIAIELGLPVFGHEREAHHDFNAIVDETRSVKCVDGKVLPPLVAHCFTGTKEEAMDKIERGFYIGFTGTICKEERGAPLREILPHLPLEKIMVETDAPFMGWKSKKKSKDLSNGYNGKKKRGLLASEPADCSDVAKRIAEVMGTSHEEVCSTTTSTAESFFRLEQKFSF